MKIFQICYEGDLTLEVATAVRRLKGEPNFDNSWEVHLNPRHSSRALSRYLGRSVGENGTLIAAETNPSRGREYLLIRHSITPGFNYAPLRRAIGQLGFIMDLPTGATWVVKTNDRTGAHVLGDQLEELCPYDSLMLTGISRDFTIRSAGYAYSPALGIARRAAAEQVRA